jgi:hypothetical protein
MQIRALVLLSTLACFNPAMAESPKNRCADFDQVALSLALAINSPSPYEDINKIQDILGSEITKSTSNALSYSWVNKKLVLIVNVVGDKITNTLLSGDVDNSVLSNKMVAIYNNLKAATSIWSLETVRNQIGKEAYMESKSSHNYTWRCDNSSVVITTNQSNNIISARIDYEGTPAKIKSRVISSHPEWDEVKPASASEFHHVWQRMFKN